MTIFLTILLSIIPFTMIAFGRLWTRKGAGKVNNILGYKTRKSTMSQESWDFAHDYIGKIFLRLGMLSLLTIPVGVLNLNLITWMMYLQIFVMGVGIIPTERALEKNFDNEGKAIDK